MRGLAAATLFLLLAGCLADREPPAAESECAALTGGDVGEAVRLEGGRGPRLVHVRVAEPHVPVIIHWSGSANGTVEFVALRTGDSLYDLKVHAPADVPLTVLAGRFVGGPDNLWSAGLVVAPGTEPVRVEPLGDLSGNVTGTWSAPVSAGLPGASWQPSDVAGLVANRDRLRSLELTLAWTNGPQGGADFAIAVASGPGGEFHYENGAFQTTLGPQEETLALDGQVVMREYGWANRTVPRIGPAVSTGSFAATGIPYQMSWHADLDPQMASGNVCGALGPMREVDVTSG